MRISQITTHAAPDTDLRIRSLMLASFNQASSWDRLSIVLSWGTAAIAFLLFGFLVLVSDQVPSLGQAAFLLTTLGMGLDGLGHLLFPTERGPESQASDPRELPSMFLALPLVEAVAVSILGAATALGVLAIFETGWLWAPGPALGLVFTVRAIRTIEDSSRRLYSIAADHARAVERAQTTAQRAELRALQSQLNPHFLFNALNAVAGQIRCDPRAAESTVEDLSRVLRQTLERSRERWSTVAEEVEYLRAYAAVMASRTGDRVGVTFSIAAETEDCAIPPLTLQPLVENCFEHGVGTLIEGGSIAIRSSCRDGILELVVSDDGPGFPHRMREGIGIGNLRERLRASFGEKATVTIDRPPKGSRVVITLPCQE